MPPLRHTSAQVGVASVVSAEVKDGAVVVAGAGVVAVVRSGLAADDVAALGLCDVD